MATKIDVSHHGPRESPRIINDTGQYFREENKMSGKVFNTMTLLKIINPIKIWRGQQVSIKFYEKVVKF